MMLCLLLIPLLQARGATVPDFFVFAGSDDGSVVAPRTAEELDREREENKALVTDCTVHNPDPNLKNPCPVIDEQNEGDDPYEHEEKSRRGYGRGVGLDTANLWPKNGDLGVFIPYEFHETVDADQQKSVRPAIEDFFEFTCIRWVTKRPGDKNFVRITAEGAGCNSPMGMIGGEQNLNLQKWGCRSKRTVLHEMLHTLGFAHEHIRNDRHHYVVVDTNNISPGNETWFEKIQHREYMGNEKTGGYPYDYYSIMHYSSTAFSKSKPDLKTIAVPWNKEIENIIGRVGGLSRQDIDEVNHFYNCTQNASKEKIVVQGPRGDFTPIENGGSKATPQPETETELENISHYDCQERLEKNICCKFSVHECYHTCATDRQNNCPTLG